MTGNSRFRHILVACSLMMLLMSPVVWAQNPVRTHRPRTSQQHIKRQPTPTNPQSPQAARKGSKGPTVTRITPQIPKANRNQTNKVFLENADILKAN